MLLETAVGNAIPLARAQQRSVVKSFESIEKENTAYVGFTICPCLFKAFFPLSTTLKNAFPPA